MVELEPVTSGLGLEPGSISQISNNADREMAIFTKIFSNFTKKPTATTNNEFEELWCNYSHITPVKIRILLFRENDKKGRRLLFDSDAVERSSYPDQDTSNGNDADTMYTEVNDGYAFTYLPPKQDVKMFCEMILGSVAISCQPGNLKIHNFDSGKTVMWSSIFQAPKISRGQKCSDTSLGSSFGCSIGSFHASETDDNSFSGFQAGAFDRDPSFTDSGVFPSFPSCSSNITSLVNTQSSRRLSSNIDCPDYGSLCNLQRRYESAMEASGVSQPIDQSSTSLSGFPGLESSSKDFSSKSELGSSVNLGRKDVLLGLGLILEMREPKDIDILMAHTSILEDIYSHLIQAVQQAYIRKKRFVITVFNGFLECQRIVKGMLSVPRLKLSAWHLCVKGNELHSAQEKLVSDLCQLNRTLNTKENNFIFSTLITGVLTHHLGWVSTVMPGTQAGFNILKKPVVKGLDKLQQEHSYDPTKIQYKELHGMLGSPVRFSKTTILSSDLKMNKCLLYVLSYFTRCSLVYQNTVQHNIIQLDSDDLIIGSMPEQSNEDETIHNLDTDFEDDGKEGIGKSNVAVSVNNAPLELSEDLQFCSVDFKEDSKANLVSSRSETFEGFFKSRSILFSIPGSGTEKPEFSANHQKNSSYKEVSSKTEKVGFTLGADENSPSEASDHKTRNLKEDPCDQENKEPDDSTAKESEEKVKVEVVEVPMLKSEVICAEPADLPSLISFSEDSSTCHGYIPGCALQACNPLNVGQWKSIVQDDLLAVAKNCEVSGLTEDCVCLVADFNQNDVYLVSAQQVVVGRSGMPIPMSPMVANMLDSFAGIVDLGLSSEDCLVYLEDQLQQIYLESCCLSEYLLSTDYSSLQDISTKLQVDPCDIPLLLAVASTHTPAVGKKLSLGFS